MSASEFLLHNEESTKAFAYNLASNAKAGDIYAIRGDLGAGKSTICRHFIQKLLSKSTNVVSPTFNLLQTYELPDLTIYHYDLYRLEHIEEVYELGIEDAFTNNICLIEWPEIIQPILPKDSIFIDIEIINDNKRKILINNGLFPDL